MISISISYKDLGKNKVKNVIQNLEKGLKQELLDVGILFLREIDLNFIAQGRPEKWEQSLAALLRRGLTGVDTGLLRASVTSQGSVGSIFEVYDLELKIGSNLPYAKYFHDGTTKSPPRPYLIISSDTFAIATEIIKQGIFNEN